MDPIPPQTCSVRLRNLGGQPAKAPIIAVLHGRPSSRNRAHRSSPIAAYGPTESSSVRSSIHRRRSSPSSVGAPVVVDPSPRLERCDGVRPVVVGALTGALQHVGANRSAGDSDPVAERVGDERLAPGQPLDRQRGNVVVAAELAQQRLRVPQHEVRLVGPRAARRVRRTRVDPPGVRRRPRLRRGRSPLPRLTPSLSITSGA